MIFNHISKLNLFKIFHIVENTREVIYCFLLFTKIYIKLLNVFFNKMSRIQICFTKRFQCVHISSKISKKKLSNFYNNFNFSIRIKEILPLDLSQLESSFQIEIPLHCKSHSLFLCIYP